MHLGVRRARGVPKTLLRMRNGDGELLRMRSGLFLADLYVWRLEEVEQVLGGLPGGPRPLGLLDEGDGVRERLQSRLHGTFEHRLEAALAAAVPAREHFAVDVHQRVQRRLLQQLAEERQLLRARQLVATLLQTHQQTRQHCNTFQITHLNCVNLKNLFTMAKKYFFNING